MYYHLIGKNGEYLKYLKYHIIFIHHFWARACKKIRDDVKTYRIPRARMLEKSAVNKSWKLSTFFQPAHILRFVVNGDHS